MDHRFRRFTPLVFHRQALRRKTRVSHASFYARFKHWSFHSDAPGMFRWARERWVLGGGAVLLALLTLIGIPAWSRLMHGKQDAQPVARETVALKLPPAAKEAPRPFVPTWQTVTVQPDDTLSSIFQAHGFNPGTLAAIMAHGKNSGALKSLHPGDEFAFQTNAKGQLTGFRYEPDAGTQVTLTLGAGDSVQQHVVTFPTERQVRFAHGVIEGSLASAGKKAGLSHTLVGKLTDVFKHDGDVLKKLKRGTHFTVVYEEIYRRGEAIGTGNVLAAQFIDGKHRYTAYRFKQSDGSVAYFSQDGMPLASVALLRTPVRYKYISSTFGMRKDPVLHRWRLHAGVDYAAPIGTPVHAAGNGVITRRGWVRGFGNLIAIRDTPAYTTEYGHLSRFASGLHVGSHVKQGQVIGYVGDTGWATGPHLHFEVVVNGVPKNPLTVTMPKPEPLSGRLLAEFKSQTAPLVAQIAMVSNTSRLAQVQHHPRSLAAD